MTAVTLESVLAEAWNVFLAVLLMFWCVSPTERARIARDFKDETMDELEDLPPKRRRDVTRAIERWGGVWRV